MDKCPYCLREIDKVKQNWTDDSNGREWHQSCAERVLGEYTQDVVEAMNKLNGRAIEPVESHLCPSHYHGCVDCKHRPKSSEMEPCCKCRHGVNMVHECYWELHEETTGVCPSRLHSCNECVDHSKSFRDEPCNMCRHGDSVYVACFF